MENLLALLLGQNAFPGGGPGDVGPAAMSPESPSLNMGGIGNALQGGAKAFQAINPPQAQKPIMSGGVTGAGLPFTQKIEDMMTPALNAARQRQNSVPMLPTFAQLLAGGH